MRLFPVIAVGALAATAACRPHPADIELMLGARGLSAEQASCIGNGLSQLSDGDWETLTELAQQSAMTREDMENMTLRDAQQTLAMLGDGQLATTLVRTGLGCMIMYGGEEWAGVAASVAEAPAAGSADGGAADDEPFDLPEETFEP